MSANRYRIVVEGELGPRYASAFDRMTLHAHDGETDIIGPITDPSHLQGLLERIAGLGLTLYSVTPLESETVESAAELHIHPAGVSGRTPGAKSKGP